MRLLAPRECAEEDRHHARLPVRVLARPVDVPVAERDVGRLVEPVVRAQVLLPRELRRPVRRERREGRRLGRGAGVALPVDRAAGGAEDHLRAVPAGGVQHPDRAEHVHLGVVDRLLDRDPDVRLGGEVEDGLRPHLVEDVVELLTDVADLESRAAGHVLPLPV